MPGCRLTGGADSITGLLQPPAEEAVDRLEFRPVGPGVGNVRNDAADLIDPVAPIVDLDASPSEHEQATLFS